MSALNLGRKSFCVGRLYNKMYVVGRMEYTPARKPTRDFLIIKKLTMEYVDESITQFFFGGGLVFIIKFLVHRVM